MLNLIKLVGRLLVTVLVLLGAFLHYIGLALLLVAVGAGAIMVFGQSPSTAQSVLWACLWVYVTGAFMTFPVMITFGFQHCCVGMQTFKQHSRHGGKHLLEALVMSTFWPALLILFDWQMRGWMMSWPAVVINVFEYWLVSSRTGVPMTTVDFQTSEVTTTRVKPENLGEAVADALSKRV